jgi:type I restriction-modification system DNA methylase subunit
MSITTTIKSIQDIMRKDAGVDGDAQRLGQLGWLLFLKIFDTPRAVTQFMVDQIDPQLGEQILEPACGTGGYCRTYISNSAHTGQWSEGFSMARMS